MLGRLVILGAAVSIPLIGCSDVPTTPQVAPQFATLNDKFTLSGTITHPCTGEAVAYEGDAHASTTTKTKGDITTIRVSAHTSSVHGVGLLSGAKYVLIEGARQMHELSATPPFPYSQEVLVRERFQSQGGADDFWAITHYTVTFDGVSTTTEVHQMEAECTG